MIAEGGGFAASLDADSEGEEGKFYVWSQAEIVEVLGEADAARLRRGLRRHGRAATGKATPSSTGCGSPLLRSPTDEQAPGRTCAPSCWRARAKRVRPGWDDKVLADWNGLMIAALAHAARVFDRPRLARRRRDAPSTSSLTRMDEGRPPAPLLARRQAKAPATASDYANMIWGALRLLRGDQRAALPRPRRERWCATLDRHYWIADGGGYAFTADDTPDVIVRMRGAHDDATPNANAIMISNLVALGLLTGKSANTSIARRPSQAAFAAEFGRNVVAHTGLLAASIDLIAPQLVVIAGSKLPGGQDLIEVIRSISLPGALQYGLNSGTSSELPALRAKEPVNQRGSAYACLGPQCSLPLTDPAEFARTLKAQRSL